MRIRIGYDIEIVLPQPTALVLMLNVHPSRSYDLETPDLMNFEPAVVTHNYFDVFQNRCVRVEAPEGSFRVHCDAVIRDQGAEEIWPANMPATPAAKLPDDVIQYLMPSRYCEVDQLVGFAWDQFGKVTDGSARVEAVVNWVNSHVEFGYPFASATRTAVQTMEVRKGVCRDFTHLALTLCRCLNIPARYATGYLGDIGVPLCPDPMDFSAYFEVYLGGAWWAYDARHNRRRIGRVKQAHGRDAADVALITSFGPHTLKKFWVRTDELS